jgi:predicted phosphodiesterase
MKLQVVELPSEYECLYLIPISDTHIGDANFDEVKLLKYIEWVKQTENARVILCGDIMNTATKESVSDTYSEVMNPMDQLRYATKIFEPIKDKIIGVCGGNHEARIYKATSIDTAEMLAQNLGVFYRQEGLFLKIKVGKRTQDGKKQSYIVYATHGFGGGKKMGGKANSLQSLSQIVLADVYVVGHTHTLQAFQDIFLVPDSHNNNIMEVKRTYCNAASFLKWGGYGETQGYIPSKLGTVRLRLDGRRKDVHVSI